ncbi:MAG: preprotein translocase subunit SecE [Elusimicrobia bacterium]|nr:preprotein translocase subunit SecE [Elusimicrobiota bacterium]
MMNWFQQAMRFFKEAYAELTKVSWLSRKEAVGMTIVVVLLVIIVAIFVGFTDFILSRLMAILF